MNTFMILGILTLFACNQKSDKKTNAIEKTKIDSIVNITKQTTTNKIEMKFALQDSINRTITYKDTLEIHLTNTKGDLAVANDEMKYIKDFHFNRTHEEKEHQIKKQTILIDKLEKKIENLKTAIQIAEANIKKFNLELKKYK